MNSINKDEYPFLCHSKLYNKLLEFFIINMFLLWGTYYHHFYIQIEMYKQIGSEYRFKYKCTSKEKEK